MENLIYTLFVDYTGETWLSILNIKKEIEAFIRNHVEEDNSFPKFIFNYNNEETLTFDVYDSLRDRMMNSWVNEGKLDHGDDKLVTFIMGADSSNIQNACIKIAQYVAFIPDMKMRVKILNDGTTLMMATTSDLIINKFFYTDFNYPNLYHLPKDKTAVEIEHKASQATLLMDYINHLIGYNETDLETMDGKRQGKMFLVSPLQLDPDDLNYHQKNIMRLLDMRLHDIGTPYPRAKTEVVYIGDLNDKIKGLDRYEVMNVVVAIPFGHNDDWQFNAKEVEDVDSEIFNIQMESSIVPLTTVRISNCHKEYQGAEFHIYGNNMMLKRLQGDAFTGLILDELREYKGE